ncbi:MULTISPECIES: type II toxin-antitoxin system antitoxin SocA domain-containing protein [unclassified Bacillus cereus group]|uniref:Panacea domain-containing protein n=1 Tax=unclassified Bacillus cereus group TaxID=2750818 RepID=UPI00339121AE
MRAPTVFEVAEYFRYLSIPGTDKEITHLKLQKLVYYTEAIYMKINQEPLFTEDFQAWVHGPVCPDLYYSYNKFGSSSIPQIDKKPNIDEKYTRILDIVWLLFGDKDGKYLENKTHQESPWIDPRKGFGDNERANTIIEKQDMLKYYS